MVAVSWFAWLKKPKLEVPPLVAPPAGPRIKTYSAASGYVYEYAFVGQRRRERETEYVFDVSYDRAHRHPISVFVADAALGAWTEMHRRELTPSERYAVAKLALRNAFDERPAPESIHDRIAPDAGEVTTILDELEV
jgi:hypothetical protein